MQAGSVDLWGGRGDGICLEPWLSPAGLCVLAPPSYSVCLPLQCVHTAAPETCTRSGPLRGTLRKPPFACLQRSWCWCWVSDLLRNTCMGTCAGAGSPCRFPWCCVADAASTLGSLGPGEEALCGAEGPDVSSSLPARNCWSDSFPWTGSSSPCLLGLW